MAPSDELSSALSRAGAGRHGHGALLPRDDDERPRRSSRLKGLGGLVKSQSQILHRRAGGNAGWESRLDAYKDGPGSDVV